MLKKNKQKKEVGGGFGSGRSGTANSVDGEQYG